MLLDACIEKLTARRSLVFLFFLCVTLFAYGTILLGGFVFDDNIFIEHNAQIRSLGNIGDIYSSSTTTSKRFSSSRILSTACRGFQTCCFPSVMREDCGFWSFRRKRRWACRLPMQISDARLPASDKSTAFIHRRRGILRHLGSQILNHTCIRSVRVV